MMNVPLPNDVYIFPNTFMFSFDFTFSEREIFPGYIMLLLPGQTTQLPLAAHPPKRKPHER